MLRYLIQKLMEMQAKTQELEESKPRTEEGKKSNKKAWNKFYSVFPLLLLGYVLILSATSTKFALNHQKEESVPVATSSITEIKDAFDIYTEGKTVGGIPPVITDINGIKNEKGNFDRVNITCNENVSAIIAVNPMVVGSYKGPGYVKIESDNNIISFSLKEIDEKVKNDTFGFLQRSFPSIIYIFNEDQNIITNPATAMIYKDMNGISEVKEMDYAN